MLAGGQGLLQGLTTGIDILQKNKEKEKEYQAAIKSAELMAKSLGSLAGQINPGFENALKELSVKATDPNVSTRERALLSQNALKTIGELMSTGLEFKKYEQQKKNQEEMRLIQLAQLSQGPNPTDVMRNTEAIIQARIAAKELDPNDAQAMSKMRAALMSRGGREESTGQPFQGLGPVQDANGNYIGNLVLDQRTGGVKVVKPDSEGKNAAPEAQAAQTQGQALPTGVRPTTASGLNRATMDAPSFIKLRQQITDDEIGLDRLSRYLQNVENAAQGIESIADRFTTAASTLFGRGDLTQEQVALALSNGQLQGLIGASRLEVLGGGVLTEQDAARIISYLGGDIGALRNKQLVKEAISNIYQDKYKRYSRGLEDYNIQVKNKYGSEGYKEATPLKIDESIFNKSPAAASKKDQLKAVSDQIAELEKRLKEMGAK